MRCRAAAAALPEEGEGKISPSLLPLLWREGEEGRSSLLPPRMHFNSTQRDLFTFVKAMEMSRRTRRELAGGGV